MKYFGKEELCMRGYKVCVGMRRYGDEVVKYGE